MIDNREEIEKLIAEGRLKEALAKPYWNRPKKSGERRVKDLFSSAANETAKDIAGTASLTFGDFLYDMSSIDTNVIEALNFASKDNVDSIFSFAYKSEEILDGPANSIEGRLVRLRGYVGERIAGLSYKSDGMEIDFPSSAVEPGYDILIDGQPFQIKCSAEIDVITEHFEKYPDIPVIGNVELADKIDNLPEEMQSQIFFHPGFSLENVDEVTRESVESGEELLDFEIPWIALTMAVGRTLLKYSRGGISLSNAIVRCAAEWGSRSALGAAGAPIGKIVGLVLFGPAGGVILGGVGAVVGVSFGAKVVDIGTELVAKNEKLAASQAIRELLNASIDVLGEKNTQFVNRVGKTNKILAQKTTLPEIKDVFDMRISKEKRDLEQSQNEIRYYYENVEELGKTPIHRATNAFDLLQRAAIHPYFVQQEMEAVLKMVENYMKRLKNPLPDMGNYLRRAISDTSS